MKQLFLALTVGALGSATILAGCSGSAVSTNPSPSAGASTGGGGGASATGRGGGVDGNAMGRAGGAGGSAGARSECLGSAPLCRGTDLQQCCGQDPYGFAVCRDGKWMCFLFGAVGVVAPGCNGQYCGQEIGGTGGQAGAGGQVGDGSAGQAS